MKEVMVIASSKPGFVYIAINDRRYLREIESPSAIRVYKVVRKEVFDNNGRIYPLFEYLGWRYLEFGKNES